MKPDSNATPTTEATVGVWITPKLEADYSHRGVFPHLRLQNATRKSGHHGLFELSLAEAKAIYEDACKQRGIRRSHATRGTSTAYTALVNRLDPLVREKPPATFSPPNLAAVLGEDGLRAVQRDGRLSRAMLDAMDASPARLAVGQRAFLPDHGEEVEIVEGFDAYQVKGDTHRRLGYVAKHSDGEMYFYPAGDLTRLDGKPAHLRLVATA